MSDFSFSSIRSDAHTLILGLGLTGAAAARWCARHGAPLRILDTREAPGGLDALRQELGEAEVDYRLGARHFDDDVLQGVGSIVLSPGLSPRDEPVAGLLALAIAMGTIAGHAFKVARANPIHALRYE